METVEIQTERGCITLEVGDNSRAFLWLFNLTQDELNKANMDIDLVTSRLVKYAGSSPETARSFAITVADLAQGKAVVDGWGTWAGQYAKKFAAEKCKRDIRFYLFLFIAGLLVSGAVTMMSHGSGMGDMLQMLLLVVSLLIIVSFYKVVLLSMDWRSCRDSAWPAPNEMQE